MPRAARTSVDPTKLPYVRDAPIVFGYIHRQLQRGAYRSVLDAQGACMDAQVNEVERLARRIADDYADPLTHATLSRPTYAAPGDAEMRRVLHQLRVHASPLHLRAMGGGVPGSYVPDSRYEEIVPPFIHQVDDLMRNPHFQPFGREDALAIAMCRWFKNSFMTWIDPIKCPACSGPTAHVGADEPTPAEQKDGGGRVELHGCLNGACGEVRRFVRYNSVKKLIETREGRCGEWAHLFYCFMRFSGLNARYVWNSEDHVWTEYWSPTLGHWVHVDSCEATTNKPLLYARGWGKKQAFCLAVGYDGIEDVTRAYVDDWPECQGRRRARGWSEDHLRTALAEFNVELRLPRKREDLEGIAEREEKEAQWIGDEARRLREADEADMQGRVSGPEDWRAQRDELGLRTDEPMPEHSVLRSLHVGSGHLDTFGSAKKLSDSIILTSGRDQTSAVYLPTPIPQSASFRVSLSFKLSAPRGAGGADGIALAFVPEKKLGTGGYGLGYSGLGGIGDFAVEIDTFRSQDFANDPPTPHISLHSPPNAHHDHSIACTQPGSIPDLSNDREHTLELLYDGAKRKVWAYLTTGGPADEVRLHLWTAQVPAGGHLDWYIGVTGACGGLWQKQEILAWSVEEIAIAQVAAATDDLEQVVEPMQTGE